MIYGSAGYNAFGYKAGCDFAAGSFKAAIAEPLAARFLCSASGSDGCLYDGIGSGTCTADPTMNGVDVVAPVRPFSHSLPCPRSC